LGWLDLLKGMGKSEQSMERRQGGQNKMSDFTIAVFHFQLFVIQFILMRILFALEGNAK
jgi:hypothetical protein